MRWYQLPCGWRGQLRYWWYEQLCKAYHVGRNLKQLVRDIQKVNRALINPVKHLTYSAFLILRYAKQGYGRAWRKELP